MHLEWKNLNLKEANAFQSKKLVLLGYKQTLLEGINGMEGACPMAAACDMLDCLQNGQGFILTSRNMKFLKKIVNSRA